MWWNETSLPVKVDHFHIYCAGIEAHLAEARIFKEAIVNGILSMSGKSKVLAYRMDDDTEQNIREAVTSTDFDRFATLLNDVEANYKTINSIKKILKKLNKRKQIAWGKDLIQIEQASHIVLGTYLIDQNDVYLKEPEFILDLVKKYCEDDDWNVRQASVDLLSHMVVDREDHMFELLEQLAVSDNPHKRRLLLLTSKDIVRSARYDDELKQELLEIINPLMTEDDPYVETVLSETFNEGFMKYQPEMTLNWLKDKLDTEDTMVRTKILTIVGSRYVEDQLEMVFDIIKELLPDNDVMVKKARSSALHTLSEAYPKEVSTFLESNLDIQNAVEHWAELEVDGTLNTEFFEV